MKLELTASVKIYQKEELTVVMISSLGGLIWFVILWAIPVAGVISIKFRGSSIANTTGNEIHNKKATILSVIYFISVLCVNFSVNSTLIFILAAIGLDALFLSIQLGIASADEEDN